MIKLLPQEVDYLFDTGRQYLALPFVDTQYGKDYLLVFYFPKSSADAIRTHCFKKRECPENFLVFREIRSNIANSREGRRIDSFSVEEVAHPAMRRRIAMTFMKYDCANKEY